MSAWTLTKDLVTTTASEVADDDITTLAAAIAYYTVFSLPPLLVILVGVAGAIYGPDRITELIAGQAASAIGPAVGEQVQVMIDDASSLGSGLGGKLVGLGALLFGATGAFGQLQKALNRTWEVEEATEEGGLMAVVGKRLLSFGMVLTIAFLLLVSLVLSSVLSYLGSAAASVAGEGIVGAGVQVLNVIVSLGVVAGLFAVMFKVLPDAEISWRDVAVGSLVTAVLFTIGKTALGIYLGRASPGSAFGAAGSLALLLVWIYYSALIVLVGAEFTQAWAARKGGGIRPDESGPAGGLGLADEPDEPAPETVADEGHAAHPLGEPRDPAPY